MRLRYYLLCALILVSHAASAVCPVDDFEDGNDAGWIHCGEWSEDQHPVWDAASGRYCLGLREPLRAPPPPPLSIAAEWQRAGADTRFHDGCVSAGFRSGSETAGTWSTHFVLGLRADCGDGGYKAMIGPSLGRMSIFRRLELLADTLDADLREDTDYRAEFCAVGAALSLRVWPADAPRPRDPQLQATNAQFRAGNIGVGVFIENDNRGPNIRGCFDDIHFTPAPGCRADFDCDGQVGLSDARLLVRAWGPSAHCDGTVEADLDDDCAVGLRDAWTLVRNWGECEPAAR